MVLGELVLLAVAHQVDPRVADVADHRLLSGDEEEHAGGPHSPLLRIGLGHLEDGGAGALHRLLHQRDGSGAVLGAGIGGERPQHVLVGGDVAPDLLDGPGRRHLARGMASHPVADDVEAERVVGEEGILVVLPLSSDVGEAEGGHVHGCITRARSGSAEL